MKLIDALPIDATSQWAFVGAGGKSSSIFALARQYKKTIIISTTTHLSLAQAQSGDHHIIVGDEYMLPEEAPNGIVIITAKITEGGKVGGLNENQINELSAWASKNNTPLLIEADGSRSKPLKAPADYEPPIPSFVNRVVILAGMSGIGNPLTSEIIHRPEIFSFLSGMKVGDSVTANTVIDILKHPQGGQKNIPNNVEKTLLLTQIQNKHQLFAAKGISKGVSDYYDQVVLVGDGEAQDCLVSFQSTAGIILAAGESSRLGRPKQFLDWNGEPFVRAVVNNAINAGLYPIIIVTGKDHTEISKLLRNLPVTVVPNPVWQEGQGTSVAIGIQAIDKVVGGAVFLLVDQPQIEHPLIKYIVTEHATSMSKIVAPLIDNQRGNPALFDKSTFSELSKLKGKKGGKQLFSKYQIKWVPWVDECALLDVDTEEDYQRLLERYR